MKLNQFEWQCEPNIALSILRIQVSLDLEKKKKKSGSIDETGIATS